MLLLPVDLQIADERVTLLLLCAACFVSIRWKRSSCLFLPVVVQWVCASLLFGTCILSAPFSPRRVTCGGIIISMCCCVLASSWLRDERRRGSVVL